MQRTRSLWRWLVGCMLLAAGSGPASAVNVAGLYSAEVEVPSQAPNDREAGLRSALATVLVKLTGDRNVAVDPAAPAFIAQAERYVQQYRYREAPPETPGALPKFYLWAAFDNAAIDQFLQDSQLPVWSRNRPLVLVWLAVEEAGQRYLVDPSLGAPLKESAEAWAAQRGLPVVFPLMDLEDQGNIQLSDVWGNFTDAIEAASARYRANVILVGRVHQQNASTWLGRWTLLEGGRSSPWESSANSLVAAVNIGVDGAADFLAKRYAQVLLPGVGERLRFRVEGIGNLPGYAKVLQYLEGLDTVARLGVTAVDPNGVVFALELRGTRENFAQVLALSEVLVPGAGLAATPPPLGAEEEGVAHAAVPDADLIYRMAP